MNINKNKKFIIVISVLLLMIFGTFLISLNTGSLSISPSDVIKTLIGQGSKAHEIAIFKRNIETGKLSYINSYNVPSPTCILVE